MLNASGWGQGVQRLNIFDRGQDVISFRVLSNGRGAVDGEDVRDGAGFLLVLLDGRHGDDGERRASNNILMSYASGTTQDSAGSN